MLYIQSRVIAVLSTLIYGLHYFVFPADPTYPYHYLDAIKAKQSKWRTRLKFILYLIFGFDNFYLVTKMHFTFSWLLDVYIHGFFLFSSFVSKEIRFGAANAEKSGKYKTTAALRKTENVTKIYRMLQILLNRYLDSVGLTVVVGHILISVFSVFTQVSLLTQWDLLTPITRTILLFSLIMADIVSVVLLDVLGRMLVESGKSISSWVKVSNVVWGSRYNSAYLKKFQKSCKPLMLEYGGWYKINRKTVLTSMKLKSRITCRALLTLRNE